jgi:hypothetical protein
MTTLVLSRAASDRKPEIQVGFLRLKADIRLGPLGRAGDRDSRESSRSVNARLVEELSQSSIS